ncbi:MAG: sugar kinase [Bryobacterales bacterium]|nr:sugar kinase [Bryobacterales bacterium]
MKSVAVSGNIVADILVRPFEEVRWGASQWVDALAVSLGGNGANTAYTLARLGTPVRLAGAVGSDEFGALCLAKLRDGGVNVDGVDVIPGESAATVALVRANGERMFLHRPGASLAALAEPLSWREGTAHYHLASPFALPRHRPHVAECLRRAKAAGLTTSLDTQWDPQGLWMETLAPALPWVDVLFVNHLEAARLTASDERDEQARILLGAGAGMVVLKQGPGGASLYTHSGVAHVAAPDVPVVDTTGAGDAFAGAWIDAWLRGADPVEAMRRASDVAGSVIQHMGAVGGL